MQTYYMNYSTGAKDFIVQSEQYRSDPYFDSAIPPNATIGYGFNIELGSNLLLVLNEMGVFAGRTDTEIATIRNQFLAAIQSTPDGDNNQLRANLDDLMQQYGASSFAFFSTSEADTVFYGILGGATIGGIIVQGKEARLDAILQNGLVHDSKEYVAVMSLFYNAESLVAPTSNLATAIINGDRAAAWYEIRYGSNGVRSYGLQLRRLRESDLFGLFNSADGTFNLIEVSDLEVKETLSFLYNRKAEILQQGTITGQTGSIDLLQDLYVLIDPAKAYLQDTYTDGQVIDRVITDGVGLSNLIDATNPYPTDSGALTTNHRDLIFAESGNDTVYAGQGDDFVYGGDGNDTLYGGEDNDVLIGNAGGDVLEGGVGDDRYIYRSGDGNDTIFDFDGNGRILFGGTVLAGGIRSQGSALYVSRDGRFTYDWNGTTLRVNDGAITIQDFSNGDLRIYLDEEEDEDDPPTAPSYDPVTAQRRIDPLVLDLNGDGIVNTVSVGDSTVYFDLDNDGFAERTGWVAPEDGLLAYDMNGNGFIGNIDEVFGSTATDGFTDLAQTADGNGDSVVNADDTLFGALVVWQDLNQDGLSQNDELHPLGELGIESISLVSTPTSLNSNGNLIIATGNYTSSGATHLAAEVELLVDKSLTRYAGAYTLDPTQLAGISADAYALPWLRGFGEVKDAPFAYSEDAGFKQFTQSLIAQGRDAVYDGFDQYLAQWSGLSDVHQSYGITRPNGLTVADKAWILETFVGENVLKATIESSYGTHSEPALNGAYVNAQFDALKKSYLPSFVAQAFLSDASEGAYYSLNNNRFIVHDVPTLTGSLSEYLNGVSSWDDAVFIGHVYDSFFADTGIDANAIKQGLIPGPQRGLIDKILDGYYQDITYRVSAYSGGSGNDLVVGTSGDDQIYGNNGSDELYGLAGSDYLDGGAGNDLLDGGAGNDYLYDDSGNDTYVFGRGYGFDTVYDYDENNLFGSTDTVRFTPDVLPSDLRLSWSPYYDTVYLDIAGTGDTLALEDWPYDAQIERFEFSDGTVWDLATFETFISTPLLGTEGSDFIYGTGGADLLNGLGGYDRLHGGSGDDILQGGADGDSLYGNYGNDTLDGGADDDDLNGGPGNDTYLFGLGSGYDYIYVSDVTPGNSDIIHFSSGLTASDIHVYVPSDYYYYSESVFLTITSTGEQIELVEGQLYDGFGIERIEFDDGTQWSLLPSSRWLASLDWPGSTTGPDTLYGTSGDDILRGFGGDDSLYGREGSDTLRGEDGADRLYGEDGDDYLLGDRGDDQLTGGAGTDVLDGGLGNDTLSGGAGNDTLDGGSGNDTLSGGAGDDIYIADRYYDNAVENANEGIDTVYASADYQLGDNVENLVLTDAVDTRGDGNDLDNLILGNDGNNYLSGGYGNDTIFGGSGNDEIRDYYGNDVLFGGDGDDLLTGSYGDDVYDGGTGNDYIHDGDDGNDVYIYNYGDGLDTIYDDDGFGRIVYRDALGTEYILDGGIGIATGVGIYTYYDEQGRFQYEFDKSLDTLAITLDGVTAITIRDYDISASELGLALKLNQAPQILDSYAALAPIRLVSAAADGTGTQSNDHSYIYASTSVSADGHYMIFSSSASNLVVGDMNGSDDIFVKDLQTGAIARVSTAADGTEANSYSSGSAISADGRYVAFTSIASNLVADDTSGYSNIFVKDLQTGVVTHASVTADGTQAFGYNENPSISADGRYVAFLSNAANLVTGDTNGLEDIFVKDIQTGVVTRANTSADGTEANNGSYHSSISADGRYIAFVSGSTNLVAGDTNGTYDIFVKDLQTGAIVRANTAADGTEANSYSSGSAISADGRYVAFTSIASNLVTGDTNGTDDVFVKDIQTGAITRVSIAADGTEANGYSYASSISADGHYVVFESDATNLVAGDTNGTLDIFVKDLQTGAIARVSTAADGTQVNGGYASSASISGDGRYVAFYSDATNLVAGDTNGVDDVFVALNPVIPFPDPSIITNANSSIVLSDISVSDFDTGTTPLAVTLSVVHGDIVLQNVTGLTFTDADGSDGTLAFSGLLSDLNAALGAGILYTPATGYFGSDELSLYVNDQVYRASLTDTAALAITVLPPPVITGTAGNDTLTGTNGNDTFNGGAGADTLNGGAGNDTYVFNLGDGIDTIIDSTAGGEINAVSFGAGINPASITLGLGSLLIRYGDQGDAIHIENFDPNDAYNSLSIGEFRFANGTVWSYADLINRGFDLTGTDTDDTISGTNVTDCITGGLGNDILNGGAGDDAYFYNASDGLDALTDSEGTDTVIFGVGYSFDNTVIRTEGGVAHLRFLDSDGNETSKGIDITLSGDGTSPIEIFAFEDGGTYTLDDLLITTQTLYGTKKADTLIGGRNDDTIYAGKGGDSVYGRTGNDTLYGEKGNDKLYGEGGSDTLYGGKGKDLLDGGAGNDLLIGGEGKNTLIGGKGDDTLVLGRGENAIRFGLGDGWDTIQSTNKKSEDSDIRFGAGIAHDDLWFRRSGNDLLVNILGTDDGLTVEGWYSNKHRPIEEFQAGDGYELDDKKVQLLVQAMAAFSPTPGPGSPLPTEMPDQLQPVLAAAWESD